MKLQLEPNVNSAFRQAVTFLRQAGVANPQVKVDWIFEKLAGYDSLSRIKTGLQDNLPENILEEIKEALERRVQGEPLAYILKECDFYGVTFFVDHRVLIPRPETEHLVDWALKWAEKKGWTSATVAEKLEILDLGTGSGCVGLTLLSRLPSARLTAVDISSDALAVAKTNAQILGLDLRAKFVQGEGAQAVQIIDKNAGERFEAVGQFDLVVANPPYIARDDEDVDDDVTKYEPHVALFGDDQGLQHIREWAAQLPKLLKPNGAAVFEFGAKQGEDVRRIFDELKAFSHVTIHKDYAGYDRYVSAER